MNALLHLWLPILLSAVVVFFISSLVHMVLKWHAKDYRALANEDATREFLRGGLAPGHYVVPFCADMKDMGSEAMKKKYQEGPILHLTVFPNGLPNMGKYLGQWFLLCLLVSATVAFLTAKAYAIDPAMARPAAKFASAISFVAYGFGTLPESIWLGRSWGTSLRYLADSALYAIGTGLVFLWLWH